MTKTKIIKVVEKFDLEENNSYEVRVYCDLCNTEIAQYDQKSHVCEDNL